MIKKILLFSIIGTVFILIIYNLFIKKGVARVFCERQIGVKIANFKSAAYLLGVIHIDEEERYINSIKNKLIQKCLD